jgi:transcriptional regulator with XRE-family HTH domain
VLGAINGLFAAEGGGGPVSEDRSEPGLDATVRRWRRLRGLTQRELADLSTLSIRALRDIESGRVRSPRPDTLRLLAEALRIDEAELFLAGDTGGDTGGGTGGRTGGDQLAGTAGDGLRPRPAANDGSGLTLPPAAPGGIIGREEETRLLMARVLEDGQRLITITGVGGVGKSRLALEVARRIDARSSAQVRWLSAGGPTLNGDRLDGGWHDPAARPGAAPSIASDHDARSQLIRTIGDHPMLLVLDGLDEGWPQDTAWLADLLRACPRLSVVSSAAAPLEVPGEWVLPLGPLELPSPQDRSDLDELARVPAVRLLMSHIVQVWPSFRLSRANAPVMAEICHLLDGLPHALEQAASACLVESPAELKRHAERDPFSVSASAYEAGGDMREMMDRSVGSLELVRDDLLNRLAKLEGDWTVEEAADQLGADLDDLAELVHALVKRGMLLSVDSPGAPRFRMLNLLRLLIV